MSKDHRSKRTKRRDVGLTDAVSALEAASDQAVDVDDVADRLLRYVHDVGLFGPLAEVVEHEAGLQRVAAIATAMEKAGDDARVLTFKAQCAMLQNDLASAQKLFADALELVGPHAFLLNRVAGIAAVRMQYGAALSALHRLLRMNPDDTTAVSLFGSLLRAVAHTSGKDTCPCKSGVPFGKCCGPEARKVLRFFIDREPLYGLRGVVAEYVHSSADLSWIEHEAAEHWIDCGALDDEEAKMGLNRSGAGFFHLMLEHAWLSPLSDEDDEDDDDASDHDCALGVFVDDPATPMELVGMADSWLHHAHWGLWRVEESDPKAGTTVTDVISQRRLYVEIPREQRSTLRPEHMLWGYFAPVDGIWRSGSALIGVDRETADQLRTRILRLIDKMSYEMGKPGKGVRRVARRHQRWSIDSSPDEPDVDEASELFEVVSSHIAYGIFPEVTGELRSSSAAPVLLNGDGDPLVIVEAEIEVDEIERFWAVLGSHPEFESHPREATTIWKGPGRGETVLATLRRDEARVSVFANSQQRYQAVVRRLEEFGFPLVRVSESLVTGQEMWTQAQSDVFGIQPLTPAK